MLRCLGRCDRVYGVNVGTCVGVWGEGSCGERHEG